MNQQTHIPYFFSCFFSSLLFVTPAPSAAQPLDDPTLISFDSIILQEERQYYFRPSKKPDQPLILVMDSEEKIGRALSLLNYYRSHHDASFDPTLVGLKNTNRFRDVTPTITEDPNYPKTGGGADRFIRFIREELFPDLESRIPHAYSSKIIVGHSGSGLFVSYLFLMEPQAFDYYLAISPSLHYDYNYTLKKARTDLQNQYSFQKIFFSVGSLEPKHMIENCQAFQKLLTERSPVDLTWDMRIIEDETHGSTYEKSFYEGLRFFFGR